MPLPRLIGLFSLIGSLSTSHAWLPRAGTAAQAGREPLPNYMKEHPTVAYKGINDLLDWLQDRRLSGTPDARRLIQALEDLDDQAREAAKTGSAPELDLAPVRRFTASTSEVVRKLAVVALARFGHPAACEQLDELINDPSPAVRETATETLAVAAEPQPADSAQQPPAPAQPPAATPAQVDERQAPAPHQPSAASAEPSPVEQQRSPVPVQPAAVQPAGSAARGGHSQAAQPVAAPVAPQAERERLLDLVREAAVEIDCTQHETTDGVTLIIRFPRGQKQEITCDLLRDEDERLDFILIRARCGPADSGNYRKALLVNQHLTFGAMTLIEAEGRRRFVLAARLPADEATAPAIKRRIIYLAATAQKIAQQLRGQ